ARGADAGPAQTKARTAPAQAGKDSRPQAAPQAPDTAAAAGDKAAPLPLPAGFVPVQSAAAPHQTELNARKTGSPTGARQTQLAAQAQLRAADGNPGKAPAAEFSAIMADVAASKASASSAAPQADLSAAQAGSISAAAGAPANSTPLPGNMGPAVNSGAQPALPGIATAVEPLAVEEVATPLQSPQWASDFGRQFVSLTQGGHNMPHTAELRLDPPELGPLRISINISDNVAHAIFTSPHAAVRQTVENALPQLQQLLAQAGISLGQTSVSDQGQPEQAFNESFGASRKSSIAATGGAAGAADLSARPAARGRAPDALVDTFA
ncbi:MAG: flagellar hook-length control protein FliK, partial [Pollutimonas bauzanensis]